MGVRLEVVGHGVFDARLGASLLEACEAAGVPMQSDCGGFAACNACRAFVVAGRDGLTPVTDEEEPFLDADDQRLGCQARLVGPCTIRLDPGL